MITIKKLTIIFLAIVMFFLPMLMTYNQQQAHAAIYSKPLTITAKKVAKELAIDSAVAMAEHILFEKALNDFLDSDLKAGFTGACLDDYRTFEDCPPDKRVQIKTDLDANDKQKLSGAVENVIEKKTNTSSKWAKFLDWFVPIFLISGLVAAFESLMDSESESLVDEIAQQSLIDAGLMLPLKSNPITIKPLYDFSEHIKNIDISLNSNGNIDFLDLTFTMHPNKTIDVSYGNTLKTIGTGSNMGLGYMPRYLSHKQGMVNGVYQYLYSPFASFSSIRHTKTYTSNISIGVVNVYESGVMYDTKDLAIGDARQYLNNTVFNPFISNYADKDVNTIMHAFIDLASISINLSFNVPVLTPPDVTTDYGTQTGVDKIKNPDGTVTTPGIDSFTYTDKNTNKVIYPSNESTTGWKDKTTGEDIAVSEDDITVDGKNDTETPTDPDEPPKEEPYPKCEKDLDKIEFKKVGTAFTYAFPFSIPWDVKRYIDAAFGGVGSERPSFALFGFFGDARIELPAYFDNWMPFLHGALVLMFDLSLIYLFYRFMGRGGD